jgi:phage antirepressor YoqD-like protein
MATQKLRTLCSQGKKLALGLAHIADAKVDYAKADLDDAGTIDGTEVAAAINATNTKLNAVIKRLEDAGVSLTS